MKKKSVKNECDNFREKVKEVRDFIAATAHLKKSQVSSCHDQAVIMLYRAFENLMLSCLICSINNDAKQIYQVTGIKFPEHLRQDVCEYIIVGEGYFDFKGRDNLIKILKRYVSDEYYLLVAVRDDQWRETLEQLSALRNFAAHNSSISKKKALKAVNQQRMGSAGSWLKKRDRLETMCGALDNLANTIHNAAPY